MPITTRTICVHQIESGANVRRGSGSRGEGRGGEEGPLEDRRRRDWRRSSGVAESGTRHPVVPRTAESMPPAHARTHAHTYTVSLAMPQHEWVKLLSCAAASHSAFGAAACGARSKSMLEGSAFIGISYGAEQGKRDRSQGMTCSCFQPYSSPMSRPMSSTSSGSCGAVLDNPSVGARAIAVCVCARVAFVRAYLW